MHPVIKSLGAAGFTDWLPIDRNQIDPKVGFGVTLSAGANLTYSIQHAYEDPAAKVQVFLTRVTTTATMKKVGHKLRVADSVIVDAAAPFGGTFAVASVVDADNITYTVANSGATKDTGMAAGLRPFSHADVAAETTDQNGSYLFPISAMRLIITAFTGGTATLTMVQTGVR